MIAGARSILNRGKEGFLCLSSAYCYHYLAALFLKFHNALLCCVNGKVFTHVSTWAGFIRRASLADNNVSGFYYFATIFFNAKALTYGIFVYASCPLGFCVCHKTLNRKNLQTRNCMTVAFYFAVTDFRLKFCHANLVGFGVVYYLCLNIGGF